VLCPKPAKEPEPELDDELRELELEPPPELDDELDEADELEEAEELDEADELDEVEDELAELELLVDEALEEPPP
jgi:hypothetical protein